MDKNFKRLTIVTWGVKSSGNFKTNLKRKSVVIKMPGSRNNSSLLPEAYEGKWNYEKNNKYLY